MKVSELSGCHLDYWVGKAEGLNVVVEWYLTATPRPATIWIKPTGFSRPDFSLGPYAPSSDWKQGGFIIERERIRVVEPQSYYGNEGLVVPPIGSDWDSYKFNPKDSHWEGHGPTPLIAAMRCFVASKFGEEVEDLKYGSH